VGVEKTRSAKFEHTGLRIIAALKIAKGVMLLGIGFGVFRLINADLGDLVRQVTAQLRIDPENRYVQLLIEKVANIDPRALRRFGFLSFVFAGDLFAEGIGLWLNKTWAKYLVLVATGVFIPFEADACLRHPSGGKWLLLFLNGAVVVYIARHLWRHRERGARPAGGA